MRNAGPTERRVRAALLGMWERRADGFSVSSAALRAEINRDGERPVSISAVQDVGRRVERGLGFSCTKSGWSELDADIEYTYSRGTFTLRRRASEREHPPKIADDSDAMRHLMGTRRGHLRTFGFLTVDRTGDSIELRSIPEGNVPKVLREWADRTNSASAARDRLLADHDPNPPSHLVAKPGPLDDPTERPEHRYLLPVTLRETSVADLLDALDDAYNHGDLPDDMSWEEPAAAEPRVTQRHLDRMREATGRSLKAARNHYCTRFVDADALADWTELVAMSLAGEGVTSDASEGPSDEYEGPVFHVTAAGFRLVYGDVRKPARKRAKR